MPEFGARVSIGMIGLIRLMTDGRKAKRHRGWAEVKRSKIEVAKTLTISC